MDKLKILVIDDFEIAREMLKKDLAQLGCTNIEEAEDGNIAWVKMNQAYELNTKFDLIICDWGMPVMTGLQLLEKCREDSKFSTILFIMLTAESENQNVIKALMSGASEYMIKPVNAAILKKKIESVLKKSIV